MNFLDAISSGKPFKRPSYDEWIIVNPNSLKPNDGTCARGGVTIETVPYIWISGNPVIFFKTAYMAKDWIIHE